ncbi:MAG: hypothetical protein ACPG31_10230, partial [Planctomycetota bacterium]
MLLLLALQSFFLIRAWQCREPGFLPNRHLPILFLNAGFLILAMMGWFYFIVLGFYAMPESKRAVYL